MSNEAASILFRIAEKREAQVAELEAELARVRPVVDAAEALVEHWGQANRVLPEDYIARNGQLLDVLAEKVKEAQR